MNSLEVIGLPPFQLLINFAQFEFTLHRSEEANKKPLQGKQPKDNKSQPRPTEQTGKHPTSHLKLNSPHPKSSHGPPPSTVDVNLSTHLSAHLTKKDAPKVNTPSKKPNPSNLVLDLDDLPLSRLVNASSSEGNIPDGKTPVEAGTPGVKVPVSSSPGDFLSDVASTMLPNDGNPAKVRMHRVEFRQFKVD